MSDPDVISVDGSYRTAPESIVELQPLSSQRTGATSSSHTPNGRLTTSSSSHNQHDVSTDTEIVTNGESLDRPTAEELPGTQNEGDVVDTLPDAQTENEVRRVAGTSGSTALFTATLSTTIATPDVSHLRASSEQADKMNTGSGFVPGTNRRRLRLASRSPRQSSSTNEDDEPVKPDSGPPTPSGHLPASDTRGTTDTNTGDPKKSIKSILKSFWKRYKWVTIVLGVVIASVSIGLTIWTSGRGGEHPRGILSLMVSRLSRLNMLFHTTCSSTRSSESRKLFDLAPAAILLAISRRHRVCLG